MFKQFLKSILPLLAILVFQFISTQAQAANCTTSNVMTENWSTVTWTGCSTSPPGATDDVVIPTNVTLNQHATVKSVTINPGNPGGNLMSLSNFFLTLTATEPIINTSTLMSRVKLSIDKDHTINGNINIFGLQWETSLTAQRWDDNISWWGVQPRRHSNKSCHPRWNRGH